MQAGFHYVANTPCRKIWTTLAVQNDRGLSFYKACSFHKFARQMEGKVPKSQILVDGAGFEPAAFCV